MVGDGYESDPIPASESNAGIIQLATQAETNTGTDNSKAITPQKLAQYVSDKITGLWEDKGLLNCFTNPNYSVGQKGDAYTVQTAGKIGGINGKAVEVRDVIYCMVDNAGGNEAVVGAYWNVIQANLVQATESIAGFAKIATQQMIIEGINDNAFVTPLKLANSLNTLLQWIKGNGVNSIIPKNALDNSANGSHSTILNGEHNKADAPWSIAAGRYADAFMYGSAAYSAGGFFNVKGSAERILIQAWGQVNSGMGSVIINIDGTGGLTNRWTVPLNTLQHFKIFFDVVQNSGSVGQIGESWIGTFQGAVKNVNGVVSWISAVPRKVPSQIFIRNDIGLIPSISFVISGTNINPTVQAIAGKNLFAHAAIQIYQTKFHLPIPIILPPIFEPPIIEP